MDNPFARPGSYDEACEYHGRHLRPMVERLRALGIDTLVEQTGGFVMVAYVLLDDDASTFEGRRIGIGNEGTDEQTPADEVWSVVLYGPDEGDEGEYFDRTRPSYLDFESAVNAVVDLYAPAP